jgi:hypothetical protein
MLFNFIINNCIYYVLILNIESKTTPFTKILSFKHYFATFVQRTGSQIQLIPYIIICKDTDLFVLTLDLVLDLRSDQKSDFFFLSSCKVHMIVNHYITYSNISHFNFNKKSFVFNFINS